MSFNHGSPGRATRGHLLAWAGLRLGTRGELSVGDEVVAIGYPYENFITYIFDEVEPTLSTGVVSALRRSQNTVQHSASLSPGNSGGPHIDSNGLVVGINVVRFADGDALQFAIPTSGRLQLQSPERAQQLRGTIRFVFPTAIVWMLKQVVHRGGEVGSTSEQITGRKLIKVVGDHWIE